VQVWAGCEWNAPRVHRRARLFVVAVLALVGLVAGAGVARAGNGYDDSAYLRHDLDNVARSTVQGRQLAYLTDLDYGYALAPQAAQTFLTNLGRQVTDLPQGRVYATLGEVLPAGAVGNPLATAAVPPTTVSFLSRTGAKLVGRLWTDGRPGPHPAVVITPGSIQGTQHMYFWAARSLAKAGYQVLTFDAQGQGESETFGHAAGSPVPTGDGFPFQQEANFVDGTVDALRYLLSTASDGYRPGGWTPAQVAAAKGAADSSLSWANPLAGTLDRTRIGLAGHSLGARAISVVQQCSDQAELWKKLPVCGGRSFPIRAVVAWDRLSPDVIPVVPGMDQQADGYFLNPQPSATAPDPAAHTTALRRWEKAGVDTYALTIRGGTHLEWVDVPYILPSTTYGVLAAEHYTVAWMDRYLSPSASVRNAASATLADAPQVDRRTRGEDQLPWTASFLSARYRGGFSFHDARGGLRVVEDLRAYGGRSAVGDWPGANADTPKVRYVPPA
jgi:dienelactone hydrolase